MKRLNFRDKQILNGFRVCGNLTFEQMNTTISQNRINDFVKEGYIQKMSYEDPHISRTKSQTAYRLTDKGKSLCRSTLHKGHFANGRHEVRHQVACSDYYLSLSPQDRMNAMNDMDQQQYAFGKAYELISEGRISEGQELIEQIREAHFVDICVVTETEITTEIVCFECITKSYHDEEIQAHFDCAHQVLQCTEYITTDIH